MDEYNVLMRFIEWCEDGNRTEWMGYHGMGTKVVTQYLDERRHRNSNTPHDAEDDDVRGED